METDYICYKCNITFPVPGNGIRYTCAFCPTCKSADDVWRKDISADFKRANDSFKKEKKNNGEEKDSEENSQESYQNKA